MTLKAEREIERDGWRLIASDGRLTDAMREAVLEKALAAARGELGAPRRRSRHASTWQIRIGGPIALEIFVKIIEPGGALGWIKRRLRGARAEHVARVVGMLADSGFAAPPIVLRGAERGFGREMIVAPRAEGDGPLRTLAALGARPGGVARKRAAMRALGAEIARLHRCGFIHGDLTPFNIFIVPAEPPRFVFIDHERTRRAAPFGKRRRMLRNLAQLGHFAIPGVTATDRMRVLSGYAAGLKRARRRAAMRRAAAMVARRIRRDGMTRVAPLGAGRADLDGQQRGNGGGDG